MTYQEREEKLNQIAEENRIAEKTKSIPDAVSTIIIEWKNKQLDSLQLTIKERQVAELILKGLAMKEIAYTLGNTEKTLKHHAQSIYKKANVSGRAELFADIFCL